MSFIKLYPNILTGRLKYISVEGKSVCFKTNSGKKVWYKDGKPHRKDGPAMEYEDGSKRWCLNGLVHRENGPAMEYEGGDKFWYQTGLLHREDGPAVEYASGGKSWYVNGLRFTKEEFDKISW